MARTAGEVIAPAQIVSLPGVVEGDAENRDAVLVWVHPDAVDDCEASLSNAGASVTRVRGLCRLELAGETALAALSAICDVGAIAGDAASWRVRRCETRGDPREAAWLEERVVVVVSEYLPTARRRIGRSDADGIRRSPATARESSAPPTRGSKKKLRRRKRSSGRFRFPPRVSRRRRPSRARAARDVPRSGVHDHRPARLGAAAAAGARAPRRESRGPSRVGLARDAGGNVPVPRGFSGHGRG